LENAGADHLSDSYDASTGMVGNIATTSLIAPTDLDKLTSEEACAGTVAIAVAD
jgi:hypothetical protein